MEEVGKVLHGVAAEAGNVLILARVLLSQLLNSLLNELYDLHIIAVKEFDITEIRENLTGLRISSPAIRVSGNRVERATSRPPKPQPISANSTLICMNRHNTDW